jgi:hypothetical protein
MVPTTLPVPHHFPYTSLSVTWNPKFLPLGVYLMFPLLLRSEIYLRFVTFHLCELWKVTYRFSAIFQIYKVLITVSTTDY